MKSEKRGRSTSRVEVVHVSVHGLWIFFERLKREFFLPFGAFPWFREATIAELSTVEEHRGNVHWPMLDVDLDIDRIEHPDRYPLVAKISKRKRSSVKLGATR